MQKKVQRVSIPSGMKISTNSKNKLKRAQPFSKCIRFGFNSFTTLFSLDTLNSLFKHQQMCRHKTLISFQLTFTIQLHRSFASFFFGSSSSSLVKTTFEFQTLRLMKKFHFLSRSRSFFEYMFGKLLELSEIDFLLCKFQRIVRSEEIFQFEFRKFIGIAMIDHDRVYNCTREFSTEL